MNPTSSNYKPWEFLLFTCSNVGGHGVCLRCLTCEMWRPRLRWTLQHSSHIKVPLFTDAQEGSGKKNDISVSRIPGGCYTDRWPTTTEVWFSRKIRHFCCLMMLVNMPSWWACLMIPPFLADWVPHWLRLNTCAEALNKQLSPFWSRATVCSPNVIYCLRCLLLHST